MNLFSSHLMLSYKRLILKFLWKFDTKTCKVIYQCDQWVNTPAVIVMLDWFNIQSLIKQTIVFVFLVYKPAEWNYCATLSLVLWLVYLAASERLLIDKWIICSSQGWCLCGKVSVLFLSVWWLISFITVYTICFDFTWIEALVIVLLVSYKTI